MDHQAEFFDKELDRTPYPAFGWLVGLAVVLLIGGGVGLWHIASYAKAKRFLAGSSVSGASDSLLNNASDAANAALDSAQAAASAEAKKQADAAASAATQALLNQSKAAISSAADAAKQSAVQAVTGSPSPSPSSTVGGADALQQYLNQ